VYSHLDRKAIIVSRIWWHQTTSPGRHPADPDSDHARFLGSS